MKTLKFFQLFENVIILIFWEIVSTIQSFYLFFWMRIFTCSSAQTHEYYSEIFQIFFADPLNKSSRRWSENKTDVRDSLVIKIRHNVFYLLIVIIGISEWLKPHDRWNTTRAGIKHHAFN